MPSDPHYLDYSERDDALSGGVRTIAVSTATATFTVWTKRVGNNPTTKLLLLHGGPGATHEYFEWFVSYLPADPRYGELLNEHHYVHHVLCMPLEEWPDPVVRAFAHINQSVYVPMQGPSELGASGRLADWDRTADLRTIQVPTLVTGAEHDTMDPAHMEGMARAFPSGTYLRCPAGSHMAMYDDQQIMKGSSTS